MKTPLAAIPTEVYFPSTEKEVKGLLLQWADEQNNLSWKYG